ncbi:hypothetical protein B0H13DRAFT_1890570 [Mycena leptocephala]|nr:hypothetical protein B0H13DRAFT_1890570 [Mycena leptocephala]
MKHFLFAIFSKGGKPYICVGYRSEQKEFVSHFYPIPVLLAGGYFLPGPHNEGDRQILGTTINTVVPPPSTTQCQATKDASTISGMNVPDSSVSPLAATAYGLNKKVTGA